MSEAKELADRIAGLKVHEAKTLANAYLEEICFCSITPAERDLIVAALRSPALEPEHTVPEGWKLVPKVPTQDQIDAWRMQISQGRSLQTAYRAMLTASPAPPSSGERARTALLEKVIARQALALMEIRTMQGDPIQIARKAMDDCASLTKHGEKT